MAAVLAGVSIARDGGTGAPRTGIMGGSPEQDLGARRHPPNPFEREHIAPLFLSGSQATDFILSGQPEGEQDAGLLQRG
jgi:hypothetical protein